MSIVLQSTGGGQITIQEPATASNFTQTLPAAAGNVVLDSATQTLTNKTIQGGAITSGTAVTASGTSVDFTSLPSWVKRITVMFNGISTNGTSRLQFQIGSGGFTTTGYIASGSNISGSSAGQSSLTTGFPFADSTIAADTVNGVATLNLITGNTWIWAFNGARNNTASNVVSSGLLALGGTLDRVRITTANGTDTFDAGSINILYE
jgi:hypothetical protein